MAGWYVRPGVAPPETGHLITSVSRPYYSSFQSRIRVQWAYATPGCDHALTRILILMRVAHLRLDRSW